MATCWSIACYDPVALQRTRTCSLGHVRRISMPAHSLAMLARRCALGVVCMHPSMSATMRVGSMCAAHPRSHVNVMRMFDRVQSVHGDGTPVSTLIKIVLFEGCSRIALRLLVDHVTPLWTIVMEIRVADLSRTHDKRQSSSRAHEPGSRLLLF
jgi:hypothetical protein